MNRRAAILVLLFAGTAWAAPPTLTIPPVLPAMSDYVVYSPQTDCKAVTYVGLSGLDPFPSNMLADPKAFCLATRGLPAGQYGFAAVGSLNDEHVRTNFVVVVGQAPPGPGPGPGPTPPGPGPGPGPGPTPPAPDGTDPFEKTPPGMKVLVVVETADLSKLPVSQMGMLTNAATRTYLNTHCGKEGSQPTWRMWDRHVATTNETPLWQKSFAKVPQDKVPWVMIGNGTAGYEGPLPLTTEEFNSLLKKYGGP